jgi:hypothetical protein
MIKATYNDVVFICTDRSSSPLAVVTNRMKSPTKRGISEPEELSKIMVGIPMMVRANPRYFE